MANKDDRPQRTFLAKSLAPKHPGARKYPILYAIPLNHAAIDPQLATASVVLHIFPATATHNRNEVSWSSEWLAEACVHPSTNLRCRKSMFCRDVRQFHEQPTRYISQRHLSVTAVWECILHKRPRWAAVRRCGIEGFDAKFGR